MTLPMLGEAFLGLDHARQQYDKLSGICATLQGLVLHEVKRQLPHGQFGQWIKENFPKSRSSSTQFMRLASEFSKFAPTCEFDNLRSDLFNTLEKLDASQLDWENPMVAEVAGWVNGRTCYQLLLNYPGQRGGARPPAGPPEDPAEVAVILWKPLLHELNQQGLIERSWAHLPDEYLDLLRGLLIDLGALVRK